MAQLWERQGGETDKAYEAFALYRDMGVNRSVRDVAQQLGKSAALIARWSSKKNWVERVSAWDDHEDERRRERNLRRQKQVEDNAWVDYETMRRVIAKRVETLRDANYVGAVSEMQALLDLMRKADDMARRNVGLPDRITENKTDLSGGLKIEWVDALSEDDDIGIGEDELP